MTLDITITCNSCGRKVRPPENAGWARLFVIGEDGVNAIQILADFCPPCTRDLQKSFEGQKLVTQ